MKNHTRRVIGWISRDAMSPAQAADAAIAKVQEIAGREPAVLHMDTVTGRLTLLADVDAPIPPGTFVRGVRFDSDPDVLAADLRSEALAARLIPGKQPRTKKALLIRGEHAVDDICASYGITRSTLYRWRNALADAEAA